MVDAPAISVVIPTYNRAHLLTPSIESILNQNNIGVSYELVVVDNNSEDDTRRVVEMFTKAGENVRYLIADKRGTSNARNCGIINTSAEILAFLDDDVRAQPDWLATIKRTFDENSDVAFIGGKVLPSWNQPPPSWLTHEHWSPLALVDYGDERFVIDWRRQVCLVSANLAVRRTSFAKCGLFSSDLYRCEDHEFEVRLLKSGSRGLYVPGLVVTADVQNERLLKNYHRSWYSEHGRTLAQFRGYEETETVDGSQQATLRLLGIPSFLYGELLRNLAYWFRASIRREDSKAFYFECHARDRFNYLRVLFRERERAGWRATISEVFLFLKHLALRKLKKPTKY